MNVCVCVCVCRRRKGRVRGLVTKYMGISNHEMSSFLIHVSPMIGKRIRFHHRSIVSLSLLPDEPTVATTNDLQHSGHQPFCSLYRVSFIVRLFFCVSSFVCLLTFTATVKMTHSRLSDEDIQSVFDVFDTDGSGAVGADELIYAFRALGWARVTEADVKKLIADFGEGASQAINAASFARLVRSKQKLADGPEEMLAAFKLFDLEGKGRISAANLKAAGTIASRTKVSDQLVGEMMRLADLDRDGYLTFEEFRKAVAKHDAGIGATEMSLTMASGGGFNMSVAGGSPKAPGGLLGRQASIRYGSSASVGDEDSQVHTIAGVKVKFVAGRVSKVEVRRALTSCGYDRETLPDQVFDEVFGESDTDNDSQLNLDEYCRLLVGFGEVVDGY